MVLFVIWVMRGMVILVGRAWCGWMTGLWWWVLSGLRFAHVCPWGKTVLFKSKDDGKTWSGPRILNDTPLDDRDCGVLSLGGKKLLVTWFTLDVRPYFERGVDNWGLGEEEERGVGRRCSMRTQMRLQRNGRGPGYGLVLMGKRGVILFVVR